MRSVRGDDRVDDEQEGTMTEGDSSEGGYEAPGGYTASDVERSDGR